MFDWIADGFNSLMWGIGSGLAHYVGDFLQNVMQAIPDLLKNVSSSDETIEVFKAFKQLSITLTIIALMTYIVVHVVMNDSEKFKKNIQMILKGVFIFAIISFPINILVTAGESLGFNCNESSFSCDQIDYTADLLNGFIYRVDENNQEIPDDTPIIDHSTNGKLYTNDWDRYNEVNGEYDKDKQKNNELDINAEFNSSSEIEGTFHYEYENPFFMLVVFLALLGLLGFAFVKLIIRVLQMLWTAVASTLAIFQSAVNQDGYSKVKEMFALIISNIIGIFLQILFFMSFATLIRIINNTLEPFGLIMQCLGLIACAVFMIDGPDQLTRLFGFDLGVHDPTTMLVAGKVASTGAKVTGWGAKKAQESGSMAVGAGNSIKESAVSKYNGSLSRAMADGNDDVLGLSMSNPFDENNGELSKEPNDDSFDLNENSSQDGENLNGNNELTKDDNMDLEEQFGKSDNDSANSLEHEENDLGSDLSKEEDFDNGGENALGYSDVNGVLDDFESNTENDTLGTFGEDANSSIDNESERESLDNSLTANNEDGLHENSTTNIGGDEAVASTDSNFDEQSNINDIVNDASNDETLNMSDNADMSSDINSPVEANITETNQEFSDSKSGNDSQEFSKASSDISDNTSHTNPQVDNNSNDLNSNSSMINSKENNNNFGNINDGANSSNIDKVTNGTSNDSNIDKQTAKSYSNNSMNEIDAHINNTNHNIQNAKNSFNSSDYEQKRQQFREKYSPKRKSSSPIDKSTDRTNDEESVNKIINGQE